MHTDEMTLAAAAHTLGLSWHAAYARVLQRKVAGRQVGRSWFVTRDSVTRYQQATVSG